MKFILLSVFLCAAALVASPPAVVAVDRDAAQAAAPQRGAVPWRRIFFRYNAVDANYGLLAYVENGSTDRIRFANSLTCEVTYVAGGRGICLTRTSMIMQLLAATLFDPETFRVTGRITEQGIPSRARVSRDGKVAAFTEFKSGDGYASLNFSTRTLLIDAASAQVIGDLESFSITRGGKPFRNRDFNFWGVTFDTDSNTFYCTLSTGGAHFLVKGNIATRSAVVIHSDVECPSLSPDGKRVAYKKRVDAGGRTWEIRTLELATDQESPTTERRSIDDQLEWLDNDTVLYTVPESETRASPTTNVWRLRIDGRSAPELFLKSASSPAVVR
jgi:hypothetical protein